MKDVKILTLLAIGVSALLAFTATAAADVATSPTGTGYTGTIKAEAEGHVAYDNPIAKIVCASSFEGSITADGAGKAVLATVTKLTFGVCTNDWHYTVVAAGTLSIQGVAGTYNGDVYWTGTTLEATRFGVNCRYATNNTTVGTFTGGQTATIHLVAAIPFHSGSFLCGSGATAWTGSYLVTGPDSLYIDKS